MECKSLSRRKFLQWSLLAAGASALSACGATPTPQAEPTTAEEPAATEAVATAAPPQTGEKVEVRFSMWEWYAYASAPVRWDEWNQKEAFPKFQDDNPNITVSWEPPPDDFAVVLTQMAAGTAADIISVWEPSMTVWAEKGQLVDLQPFVDRDIPNADDIYLELAWKQMWNPFLNMRMAMLADLDITSIYYNKTAFGEANVPLPTVDWTIDDYVEAAVKLTKEDDAGNITRWGSEIRGGFWDGYLMWVRAFGNKVRDDETQMKCLLDQAEAIEGLEWIRKGMYELNCFAQPNQMGGTGLPNTWTGAVPAGILAMAERSADQFFSMADSVKDFEWDIAHVPKTPRGRSCMGLPDQWVMYKGAIEQGKKEQVWSFLKFLAGDWYQEKVASVAGRIPCLKTVVAEWANILRKIDGRLEKVRLETLTEQMDMGYPEGVPMFRFQAVASEIINPAMEQIFVEGKVDANIMKEIAPQVTEAQQKALAEQGG